MYQARFLRALSVNAHYSLGFGTPLNQGFAVAGTDSGHQFNSSFSCAYDISIPRKQFVLIFSSLAAGPGVFIVRFTSIWLDGTTQLTLGLLFQAYQHSQLGLTDWIHNSNHYTAVASRALMIIYYGRQPVRSYFTGCSTGKLFDIQQVEVRAPIFSKGGGQALALAELWPEDFDGIHAGCPGRRLLILLEEKFDGWKDHTTAG